MKKRKKIPYGAEQPRFEGYTYPRNLVQALNLRLQPVDRIAEPITEEQHKGLADAVGTLNGQEQMVIKLLYEQRLSYQKASEASGIELKTLMRTDRVAIGHLAETERWRLIKAAEK